MDQAKEPAGVELALLRMPELPDIVRTTLGDFEDRGWSFRPDAYDRAMTAAGTFVDLNPEQSFAHICESFRKEVAAKIDGGDDLSSTARSSLAFVAREAQSFMELLNGAEGVFQAAAELQSLTAEGAAEIEAWSAALARWASISCLSSANWHQGMLDALHQSIIASVEKRGN